MIDFSNQEFIQALYLMEESYQNLFITGEAGSGKSTLLRTWMEISRKQVAILAPTGLAAINIKGETIHSFFRLAPQDYYSMDSIEMRSDATFLKKIRALQTIVIDEISMVRADMLDIIDQLLQKYSGVNLPFGGRQIIMIGDLFQLPPIVKDHNLFKSMGYASSYFFDSKVIKGLQQEGEMHFVKLIKNYRQSGDSEFNNLLNQIRLGRPSPEILARINQRVAPITAQKSVIRLTTTNQTAGDINTLELNSITKNSKKFTAKISGEFTRVSPTQLPAESELNLKVGAQVMFIKNDLEKHWVNGNFGKILDFKLDEVLVQRTDTDRPTEHWVGMETWELYRYQFNTEENAVKPELVGSFRQLPLKLAWAVTIHKSQGQTYNRVHIDLGRGAFAHGQTYVALSRCRSLEGVYLARAIQPRDIIVDRSVIDFDSQTKWNIVIQASDIAKFITRVQTKMAE